MGRKIALVIGNSQYDDAGLARLATADVDVRELASVLRATEVGQFETVIEIANQSVAVVRRAVAHFFSEAKKDDLLLLYFSGHGVKDEQGSLYLAVKDTERRLLAGTSIEAAFITAQMDRSHSKRQILILDCCHSGAFSYGAKAEAGGVMGTGPAFEGNGYGRVVLTATDSTQYAWEGNQVIGDSDKSVFTHYLLQGLRTGEADRDGDGLITIDELYDYVYEHVVSETPRQTPGKWTYKQQGEIVVARNPHPPVKAAPLPLEVQALIESPLVRIRTEAVPELAALLTSRHPGLVLAAREALERLRTDDSRKVAAAAEEVLSKLGSEAAANEQAERNRQRQFSAAIELADRALAERRLDEAQRSLDLAEESSPEAPAVAALRARLADLRGQEDRDRQARERQQKVEALLAKAERAASHEAAIEAVNEALELDPRHETARHLLARQRAALEQEVAERARRQQIEAARQQIGELLQQDELSQAEQALAAAEHDCHDLSAFDQLRQRLRQKQHDRRASEAVASAGREFAAGRHDPAVAALEHFTPPHPVVSRALAGLKAEIDVFRRREEEQRRLAAARAAREREIASELDAARTHIGRQQFVEAIGALQRVKQLDPATAGLAGLVEIAEAGKVAAEEAERRRQECQSRLEDAQKRFRRRDFVRALALTEEALRVDPQNPDAVALRAEIQRVLDEQAIARAPAESTTGIREGWFHSKPLQLGLVVAFMAAAFILYRVMMPPPKTSPRALEQVPSAQQAPRASAAPSPPPETKTEQPPSSIPREADRTPAVIPSSAPSGTRPSSAAGQREQRIKPRDGANDRRVRDTPVENPLDVAQPGPSAGAPLSGARTESDVAALSARLLDQGDKLLQARNYDGAVLAYEDASRLGNTEGQPRAEKARQQKALEVRTRLSRAERLQDTGDYEGALRAVDEALALEPKSAAIRELRQRVLDAQSFERGLRPKKFE